MKADDIGVYDTSFTSDESEEDRYLLRMLSPSDLDGVHSSAVRVMLLHALQRSRARFPVCRFFNASVRRPREEVLDDMALHAGLMAQRLTEGKLLLHAPDVLVSIESKPISLGCTLQIELWAQTTGRLGEVRSRLLTLGGEHVPRRNMFTLDWKFGLGPYDSGVTFDEEVEPELLQEAYSVLQEPVHQTIERYLDAPETVLILLGPPGTGKTRLVRAICTAISRRKNDSARILYTADEEKLSDDGIFARFITGNHDALVIEDADHLMKSRDRGNRLMHRFLAIADGIVRAQGRKIIFTSNLPSQSDIDEALLRPGRTFRVLQMRLHTRQEAMALIRLLLPERLDRESMELRLAGHPRGLSLAQIYQLAKTEENAEE